MRSYDDDDDEGHRPGTSGGPVGAATATARHPQRAQSPPWVPNGARPASSHTPHKPAVSGAGGRRSRAVEHTHVFLDDPDKPPTHPANFFWLYGAFDYKMQTPPDQARQAVFKIIDKLIERMNRITAQAQAQQQQQQQPANGLPPSASFGVSPRHASGGPAPPIGSKSGTAQSAAAFNQSTSFNAAGSTSMTAATTGGKAKAHCIFDIISTKKHITLEFEQGQPYLLGQDIYRYIDKQHTGQVVTTFVGMSDNTARRVGRDVYYSRTDDLSKSRIPFSDIDNERMFIVFPPASVAPPSDATTAAGNASGAAGGPQDRGAGRVGRRSPTRASPTKRGVSPTRRGSPRRVPRPGR